MAQMWSRQADFKVLALAVLSDPAKTLNYGMQKTNQRWLMIMVQQEDSQNVSYTR